jgi:hypothetical protein
LNKSLIFENEQACSLRLVAFSLRSFAFIAVNQSNGRKHEAGQISNNWKTELGGGKKSLQDFPSCLYLCSSSFIITYQERLRVMAQ